MAVGANFMMEMKKSQRDKESRMLEDPALASATKKQVTVLSPLALAADFTSSKAKRTTREGDTPRALSKKQTASREHEQRQKLERENTNFLLNKEQKQKRVRAHAQAQNAHIKKNASSGGENR